MFKHLRANELLFEHHKNNQLKPTSKRDVKFVIASEHPEIETQVELYIAETFSFLHASRVDKLGHLSIAEWIPEKCHAIVTHQVSKIWSTIGINLNRSLVINPLEIMFLLESNQLELMYKNVSMSLEQASIMLSKDYEHFTNHYRVYAQLRRYGYVIMLHNSNRNLNQNYICEEQITNLSNADMFDLNVQLNAVEHNSLLDDTKSEPTNMCSQKGNQSKWKTYKEKQNKLKRKESGSEGKIRNSADLKRAKLLDPVIKEFNGPLLKNDSQYSSFAEIYKSLQISGKEVNNDNHASSHANICLDLYRPNNYKKKAMDSPNYRIDIISQTEKNIACDKCLRKKRSYLGDNISILLARVGMDNISYFVLMPIDL